MGNLTYTYTLVAGQPENVNQLEQKFTDIRTIINGGIDATNITAGSITNTLVSNSASIAGSKLDTTDGRLQQTTGIASASGDLSMAGAPGLAYQDVAGATVTFTPDVAAYALVHTVFDFSLVDTDQTYSTQLDGALVVDGVVQTALARLQAFRSLASGTPAASYEGTVTQVYRVALTAAAHTLKLQAKRTQLSGSGNGTYVAKQANTNFLYQLVAQ